MILHILSIILPIVVIAAAGFYWSYRQYPYDSQFVAKWVMDIAAPCLILSTLLSVEVTQQDLFEMSVITLSGLCLLLLINAILLKCLRLPLSSYINPLTFANTGNMGLPICLFAFGESGLALALVWFMLTSIVHFSVGISLVGGRHPLKVLLSSPVFYATMLSVLFILTGWKAPVAITNTLQLLGGAAIPLMLFSLGVSIQCLKVAALSRCLLLACWRLGFGLMLGVFLCWVFALEGQLRGVVIIQSTMPAAVFNYLMALNYQRDPEDVAGIVVFSTLISFVTLPLLLWFVL